VQTFLPYPDFQESARVLDDKRLGKQRVEGLQILNIITKPDADYRGGWRNHPAVKMWRGYDAALKAYTNAMIAEWVRRGFQNTMQYYELPGGAITFPWWLGDACLHESHQSNLLRKNPAHYRQFGWTVPPDLPYFWPV
jgi:hypothetical protein